MYTSQSTNQTEEFSLLEEFNCFLEKQPSLLSGNNLSPESFELLSKDTTSFPSTAPSSFPFIRRSQSLQLRVLRSNNLDFEYILSEDYSQNRLRLFYRLLEKLVNVDQETIYFKNIVDRLWQPRREQQRGHEIDIKEISRVSAWEYLPKIEPFPSEQEVRISDRKLRRCWEEGKRVWEKLRREFSSAEAEIVWRDWGFGEEGLDVFDLMGVLERKIGEHKVEKQRRVKYEVRDVLNIFRRITRGDEIRREEFVRLFCN